MGGAGLHALAGLGLDAIALGIGGPKAPQSVHL
jgi:hypothetical protein